MSDAAAAGPGGWAGRGRWGARHGSPGLLAVSLSPEDRPWRGKEAITVLWHTLPWVWCGPQSGWCESACLPTGAGILASTEFTGPTPTVSAERSPGHGEDLSQLIS